MNPPPTPSSTARKNAPGTVPTRSPMRFFGLVFALSIPFWLVGAITGL
jgi:hypothetical protein